MTTRDKDCHLDQNLLRTSTVRTSSYGFSKHLFRVYSAAVPASVHKLILTLGDGLFGAIFDAVHHLDVFPANGLLSLDQS